MSAAHQFVKAFSPQSLNDIYIERIQHRASIGLDSITPKSFEKNVSTNIQLISKKVLNGTYSFTRYREVLISKGRGKEPRVISIPTIRDKLALASYHQFLQRVFSDAIEEPLLHTVINSISRSVLSNQYDSFVKVDITKFYSSINHKILLKKIRRRIRKKEALSFLQNAISTQTIARNTSVSESERITRGVPEGLSISNILADIYLSDLKSIISQKYNIEFFRYVDDILILCKSNQASEIKEFVIKTLFDVYDLHANTSKTISGQLIDSVPFLGYVFSNNRISIRPAAEQKLECALEELFRKHKYNKVSYPLFVWRLNLRITRCILEYKKYGWMFYYSQMSDLKVLFHLDWLVNRYFDRFKIKKPNELKSFVRTYHEITKNVSHSTYLINVDLFSLEQKRRVLSEIYGQSNIELLEDERIETIFRETMFRETERLEHDIQNFS